MENQEKEVKDFVINYTDGSSVTVEKVSSVIFRKNRAAFQI